jgi:hypothetical protein
MALPIRHAAGHAVTVRDGSSAYPKQRCPPTSTAEAVFDRSSPAARDAAGTSSSSATMADASRGANGQRESWAIARPPARGSPRPIGTEMPQSPRRTASTLKAASRHLSDDPAGDPRAWLGRARAGRKRICVRVVGAQNGSDSAGWRREPACRYAAAQETEERHPTETFGSSPAPAWLPGRERRRAYRGFLLRQASRHLGGSRACFQFASGWVGLDAAAE